MRFDDLFRKGSPFHGNRHHRRLQTSQACRDQYRASRNEWQAQTIPDQSFRRYPSQNNTDQQYALSLSVLPHELFLQFFFKISHLLLIFHFRHRPQIADTLVYQNNLFAEFRKLPVIICLLLALFQLWT